MDHQPPPATKPRSRTRVVVQAVFSLALVVVLFYYLLKDVDLAQVWANIRAMTWIEDAALAAIAAWNLATYGLLWMSVTPGLGFGRAMVMTQAASAVTNTVPTVGPAIGVGLTYSMLRSWGYSGSRISVAVLVSGVWNTFAKLGLPVLALALLACGAVAPEVRSRQQADCRHEIASLLSCSPRTICLRRLLPPIRRNRAGGSLGPALLSLLPRPRGAARRARSRRRPLHHLPLGATVHAAAGRRHPTLPTFCRQPLASR
jgi:hypothetical protein